MSVLTIDGKGQATPLVQGTFNARNAEVSPDGRWMAYESDESSQRQVYVRPFPDVNSRRWQVSTAGGSQPAWAPNGRELFYIDGNSFLTAVPVQTAGGFNPGAPTKLFELRISVATATARYYDVSRDGQRFVFIKDAPVDPTAAPASMVVVLNWVEELKAKVGR